MKDLKHVASIIGATVIFIIGISLFIRKPASSQVPVDQDSLVLGTANVRGPRQAPVTLVEFSDLECPACQQAQVTVWSLLDDYGDRIQYIYRHFPLTAIHQHALASANAAEAAAQQGKFWQYLEVLFDQQDSWSPVRHPTDLFLSYAQQVGIADIDQFRQDLKNQAFQDRVLADLKLGNESGVNAAPTFFVNGEKADISGLKLAVEKVLSKPE